MEQLLADSGKGYCLAYFYCARNAAELERSEPEAIIRSIVRQMSIFTLDESIFMPVAQKYKEREENNFAAGTLRLDESIELIIKLTASYSRTIIVIDALDECNPETRYKLMGALTSIIQKGSGLVNIFVSSRDDGDIFLHLKNSPNLYIKASDNAEDICQYIQIEVRQAIANKRLLGGDVSPELSQEITETMMKQAQGM